MAGGAFEKFMFWVIALAVKIWLVFRGIPKEIARCVSWASRALGGTALRAGLALAGRVETLPE